MDKEKLEAYPKTDKFRVKDTIGVPHPYCITSKHLEHSTGIYLNIPEAESKGAVCDICKTRNKKYGEPILSYEQHEQALLIEVNDDRELKDIPELHPYLLSIKEQCTKDGCVGFAFVQKRGK